MNNITKYGLHEFHKRMYEIIDMNYTSKGDSWVTCDRVLLRDKLHEEIEEYETSESDINRMKELVDIANICNFLYMRILLEQGTKVFSEHLKELRR